jgi:hypothetical protein
VSLDEAERRGLQCEIKQDSRQENMLEDIGEIAGVKIMRVIQDLLTPLSTPAALRTSADLASSQAPWASALSDAGAADQTTSVITSMLLRVALE